MIRVVRKVAFDDVDASGHVPLSRLIAMTHETLEAFFAGTDGGYAHLVTQRRIGVPAVRVVADAFVPVAYGDELHIDVACTRLGRRSASLGFVVRRTDGMQVARIEHDVVVCNLDRIVSIDMPDDVRRCFLSHLSRAFASLMETPWQWRSSSPSG